MGSSSPVQHREPDETTSLIASAKAASKCTKSDGEHETDKHSGASPTRLLLPFLLYCTAMGAVAVPKVNIILAVMCAQYGDESDAIIASRRLTNDQICNSASIHARMGRFMMWANIISGVGCAFSSPRLGSLSDRYGRKPLLAFSALGLLFGDVISIIAGWFPRRLPVYWILLEFGIGGLTGSFVSSMAIIQSYAADCTKGDARVSNFSRLHACMYLGVALGPAAGGAFIQVVGKGDLLSVLYAAGVCHAAFIAFVLFGVEESLPRAKRASENWKSMRGPSQSDMVTETSKSKVILTKLRFGVEKCNLFRPLAMLRPTLEYSSKPARKFLPLLASIDGIAFGVNLGLTSVLILYAEHQYGWRTMSASLFISITNATRAAILACILPMGFRLAKQKARETDFMVPSREKTNIQHNLLAIRIALFFDLVSQLGFVMANHTAFFTVSGMIAAAGAPASPIMQSLMTNYVAPEKTGELLGAISLCHALARSVIPASLQLIYSLTVANAPRSIFCVLSVIFACTFIVSLTIRL
ncbi:MAG: hypothetical protein FE78DRAFT_173955 [Acidomyces sp. 'richmondensis']|nr:MAG: hypothetical protein FE78DRAFT_173955 [Acidomyces sp. 'richmondensis']